MKAIAEVLVGAQAYAAQELTLLGCTVTGQQDGLVFFDADDATTYRACYRSQSSERICKALDLQDLEGSFCVRARVLSDDVATPAAEATIGARLLEECRSAGVETKVDLSSPKAMVRATIVPQGDDTSGEVLGIDLSGDIGKRDYKVFASRSSLRATLGFCAVLASGFTGKQNLLDPMCGDGVIPIEAAMFAACLSHNRFRKKDLPSWPIDLDAIDRKGKEKIKGIINALDGVMPNVVAAGKNAKLAGVERILNFSRISPDWLDTKFTEHEVDCIATWMPNERDKDALAKRQQELLYQADYILAKTGTLALLHESPIPPALLGQYHFSVQRATHIQQGGRPIMLSVLKKISK